MGTVTSCTKSPNTPGKFSVTFAHVDDGHALLVSPGRYSFCHCCGNDPEKFYRLLREPGKPFQIRPVFSVDMHIVIASGSFFEISNATRARR